MLSWILVYIAGAVIAMFLTVRWDNKLNYRYNLDSGGMFVLIAVFWPIAFPLFAAYFVAHKVEEEEK